MVGNIANAVSSFAEVKYWDKDKTPGKTAWTEIFSWIDASDVVLAIITNDVVSRGLCVGQEIGHAIAKGKKIIPLVGPNVNCNELGCLNGITYQKFDPANPMQSIETLAKQLKSDKNSQDTLKTLLVVVLGFLLLWWFSSK